MLKYINYQLLDDEEQQKQLERAVAPQISRNIRQNIDAFRQYIPSMLSVIEQHEVQQHSLFCTREKELNIVDFATGRVYYSDRPRQEIADELSVYFQNASYFNLLEPTDGQAWRVQSLPSKVQVMLVFGLGLGLHLLDLISGCRIRYLVVYEPSVDVFLCSLQAAEWRELLDTAAAINTQIFLQIGSDASGLPAELTELLQHDNSINQIFVYRHQFHPVMDDVISYIMKNHGKQEVLTHESHSFTPYKNYLDYVAERAGNVVGNYFPETLNQNYADDLFNSNLLAFKRFYPKVYETVSTYKVRAWELIVDPSGQENLYHRERRAMLYHDLSAESEELYRYFAEHPFRDDIVLNQRITHKLRKFVHFKYIKMLQPLLERTLSSNSKLPEHVDSLIIFGIGLGKHVELLLDSHEIKNLYICEPNLDFFVASLKVVDWAKILEEADRAERRIYLNLGGDGSHYFYDLMAQFYQVGAYSIANTYMLCSYYNVGMQKAISDLRSELKVVLALGEYYDHARYGLAHTFHSLKNEYRYLKANISEFYHHKAFGLPVFIVGNGPSLDSTIEYLEQYRDQVILISCGTALKSLYKNGIRPDFHAEIEQNRATYDWITQIDDVQYLSNIRLLSVNGIHPDTAALFKETLLCFKDGEASTYIYHNALKSRGFPIASLAYAYPTVTNLVMNYCLKIGFKYLYLFGVDLGFADVNAHHSKHSSYYLQDGRQIYNYQTVHGGGVPATGNFQSVVFTKPEFDVSRKLLEQAISKAGRGIEVYNCSNGVKIKGAVSLYPSNILLTDIVSEKETLLADMIQTVYYPEFSAYAESIRAELSSTAFEETIEKWLEVLDIEVTDIQSAKELIEKQWQLLRRTAGRNSDPTFCLFHGSANYISGVLLKISANINESNPEFLQTFNDVIGIWREYLKEASEVYLEDPIACDAVTVDYLFTQVFNPDD